MQWKDANIFEIAAKSPEKTEKKGCGILFISKKQTNKRSCWWVTHCEFSSAWF